MQKNSSRFWLVIVGLIATVVIMCQYDVFQRVYVLLGDIIGSIVGFFNIERDINSNIRENQRDLLTLLAILIAIMALVGTGVYKILNERIKKTLKETEERVRHYTTAQAMKTSGVFYYKKYIEIIEKIEEDNLGEQEKNKQEKKAHSFLKTAERDTAVGLKSASELCELSSDYELLLCILKNNMACMIFRLEDEKRKYEALTLVNYSIERLGGHTDHADEWFDTKKKVLDTFFEGKEPVI